MHITLKQLPEFVHNFLNELKLKTNGATVVLLQGNLGAGKTTFTKELAQQLGITEAVTSPTFVIEKRYVINYKDFKSLLHIDAYRLRSGDELEALGIQEELNNPENLIVIEWPEQVETVSESITEPIKVSFNVIDEQTRDITVTHGNQG